MNLFQKLFSLRNLLLLLLAIILSDSALAESRSLVARLSYYNGSVSLQPSGETLWAKASLNRPLIWGDTLWLDKNSKAELQLSSAILRLNELTNLRIVNLSNNIAQFRITRGSLILSISSLKFKQTYEIDTPNLALLITKPGYYRVDVNKNGTHITVFKGKVSVYGDKIAFNLKERKACLFSGLNLKTYRCFNINAQDSFDQWSLARSDRIKKGNTNNYVSTTAIGYEDLSYYGKWKKINKYGQVWFPTAVDTHWAPYRMGHWVWIRQWGWTWVDNQPWGFTPFHYGRWLFVENRWAWVPGPKGAVPIYAPALVAFMGGQNNQLKITTGSSGIAWFPLGPGEVYIPPYQVSRNYFTQINVSNTIISNTYINNAYTNKKAPIQYQNIQVENGITAVPTKAFIQSEPVNQAQIPLSKKQLLDASVTPIAIITPESSSLLGSEDKTVPQPSAEITNQPVVAITPSPEPIPFSKEQELLSKNPGTPLTSEEIQKLESSQPPKDNSVNIVVPQPTTEPQITQPENLPDDLKQNEAQPKQEVIPQEQPKQEVIPQEQPKQEVIPQEQPKQEVIPQEQPKQEVIPQEEPKLEVIPQEQPNQEVVPQEQPNQEVVPQEQPNQEVVPQEQPNQEVIPQEQPNQEGMPQEQPNQEGMPQEQPNQEGMPQEQPNQEVVPQEQPNQEVVPQEQPNQEVPQEQPNQEAVPQEQPNQEAVPQEQPNEKIVPQQQPDQGAIPEEQPKKIVPQKQSTK